MNGVMTEKIQNHENFSDSIQTTYMRVVSGVRLAFQAGTGEFEPLRPLQIIVYKT